MTTKLETMLNELIENLSTAHVNHAELEPIKQEILQEALKPTVYRLDYYDGEYYWYLVHSYDRAQLEKLIADATEYHKTIKDLDFDDDEAVDAWLEKHPLNDFDGDQINDLLDIDDYEPLSAYLSINSFEVSGGERMTQLSNVPMQPKPDAVERPMTLIEKLEQEVNRLLELKAQEKPHSLGYVFLGHHIAATVNAINIVKQHEAESEVQDETA